MDLPGPARIAAKAADLLRARRTHVIGVGTAKSGTTSLYALFAREYRAIHEAGARRLVDHVCDWWENPSGPADRRIARQLRVRDALVRPELTSSQLNGVTIHHQVRLFPDARFVLTIREPLAWMRSFIDHELARPAGAHWRRWRQLRFSTSEGHPAQEAALADRGLFPIAGYLGHWAWHNKRVLATVPSDQLLVVRTDELTDRVSDIAAFAGVPMSSLDGSRSHSFPAAARSGVLDEVPAEYVHSEVDRHCGELVKRFFPEQA